MGLDKLINLTNICIKHKKLTIKTKLTKKELTLIETFIKINIVHFLKKIDNNTFIIKINTLSKIKLKNFSKKKLSLTKNSKNFKKNIFIVSNSTGIHISQWKNVNTGLLLLKVCV